MAFRFIRSFPETFTLSQQPSQAHSFDAIYRYFFPSEIAFTNTDDEAFRCAVETFLGLGPLSPDVPVRLEDAERGQAHALSEDLRLLSKWLRNDPVSKEPACAPTSPGIPTS